ncbi:hypothetical protein QJS66_16830 [Kocuria rhizophila]|nr:hypothetical protein QJS66_16830 [Kocuria rhizophila]
MTKPQPLPGLVICLQGVPAGRCCGRRPTASSGGLLAPAELALDLDLDGAGEGLVVRGGLLGGVAQLVLVSAELLAVVTAPWS